MPNNTYTPPNLASSDCDLHTNERTRVQHKTTGQLGYLSSYRGMDSLYTQVTWLDGPNRRLWTQEATHHLEVIATDRYCLTHRDWEQVTASAPVS